MGFTIVLAWENEISSIAFQPSVGLFSYPIDLATRSAIETIRSVNESDVTQSGNR